MTLPDILFGFGDASLKPGAADVLKQVADTLAGHQDLELLVTGHTDDVGSAAYNLQLSQKRADAVVTNLAGRGIKEARLTAIGEGKQRPL